MKTISVLIPSAGFASFDLLEHLKNHKEVSYNLILSDMDSECPGKIYADKFYVSPPVHNKDFKKFIFDVCAQNSINVILPGKTIDALFFSEYKNEFEIQNIGVVISDHKAIINATDKHKSFKILIDNSLPVPDYHDVSSVGEFELAVEQLGYPNHAICMKPSRYPSDSGRGFRIMDPEVNISENMFWEAPSKLYYTSPHFVIDAMIKCNGKFPPQLIMEYLPGEEYSVYCFCDKGNADYIVPNRRVSLHQMSSKEAVVEKNSEIETIASKICKIFGFDGPVNIQLKYASDGIPKLIEINPRMAGTIMLSVKAGVDMVHFGILKALRMPYPKDRKIGFGTGIKRDFIAKYYYNEEVEKI